jgi:hypothetical protein
MSGVPKWFIISMFASYLERKPPRNVTFRSRQRSYFYRNSVRLPADTSGVVREIAAASLPFSLPGASCYPQLLNMYRLI